MGTRSLTRILDNDGQRFCSIYRHRDGYPTGHGQTLKNILEGIIIVDGMRSSYRKIANGIDCLAATLIKELKNGNGDIYLYHPDAQDVGEDFIYTLRPDGLNRPVHLKVEETDGNGCATKELYNGSIEQFEPNLI
jgi:hypothetical protein